MYVAVKGGEAAIGAAHRLLADRRRGPRDVPALRLDQIAEQLSLAVDRVMAEGALYDTDLAARAVQQARGDLIEAIFLLRAYRTTLPRLGASRPLDTGAMRVERRISATFKDIPGGQLLGPTFDYTHRLIEDLPESPAVPDRRPAPGNTAPGNTARGDAMPDAMPEMMPPDTMPRVTDLLGAEGLIEADPPGTGEPADLTRAALAHPAGRDLRLQALARGDEGFLLALGYSTQRGYGRTHPFVAELRIGLIPVEIDLPELGFSLCLGEVRVTECQMVSQFRASEGEGPRFTRGYGLVFGQSERKAMAMALVDRSLRAGELGEATGAPAQDGEFVLSHCDNVQATGFVEHLKLPHYVDFQAELKLLRQLREEAE